MAQRGQIWSVLFSSCSLCVPSTTRQDGSLPYPCIHFWFTTFDSRFQVKIIQSVMNMWWFSYLFCSLSQQDIRTRKQCKYRIEQGLLQQNTHFLFQKMTHTNASGVKEARVKFCERNTALLLTSLHPVSFSSCLSSRQASMRDERPPPQPACGHRGEGKQGRRRQPMLVSKRP